MSASLFLSTFAALASPFPLEPNLWVQSLLSVSLSSELNRHVEHFLQPDIIFVKALLCNMWRGEISFHYFALAQIAQLLELTSSWGRNGFVELSL